MPIDIQCNECKKRFRVPDKFGGRRIKCPNCEEPIVVRAANGAEGGSDKARQRDKPAADSGVGATPAVEQPPATDPKTPQPEPSVGPAAEVGSESPLQVAVEDEGQWYLQTDDGEQYGPVDREELEAWAAEGRIDGTCQLLCDGWDQWRWADEVFPDLDEEGATADGPITVRGDSGKVIAPAVATRSDTKLKARAARDVASTAGVERTLAETRPWVLLMAIAGFAGAGLGGVGSLIGLLLSAVALAIPGVLLSLVLLATYGLAGWAAFHLLVYAQRIQAYVAHGGTAELERAMAAQRSFWRLAGILTLVATGMWLLIALLMAVLVLAGVAAIAAA